MAGASRRFHITQLRWRSGRRRCRARLNAPAPRTGRSQFATGWRALIVAGREAGFHSGRQRNSRILHLERSGDPRADQRFIVHTGAPRQRLAEEADLHVRVFELGTDIARQLVGR